MQQCSLTRLASRRLSIEGSLRQGQYLYLLFFASLGWRFAPLRRRVIEPTSRSAREVTVHRGLREDATYET